MRYFSLKNVLCVVGLGLIFLIVGLRPNWEITGDGYGYYSYLRSAYFDHDLNFGNELRYYDATYRTNLVSKLATDTGRYGNMFAIGLAIFLVPFFLLARATEIIFSLVPSTLPGLSAVYQIYTGLATFLYFLSGCGFLYAALRRLTSAAAAWFATLATVFATPLVHYAVYEPHMSHGISFATTAVVFYVSTRIYRAATVSWRDVCWLAFATALMILVRWQNLLVGLLPLTILLSAFFQKKMTRAQLISFVVLVVVGIFPQLAVWKYLYGAWLLVPQGSGFVDLWHPHGWVVLFSGYHGLFSWHPLTFLAAAAFIFLGYRCDRFLYGILLAILFGGIYVNASLADWWGGAAFGARKMDSIFFILAYGLTILYEKIKNRSRVWRFGFCTIIFVGIFWNLLLMLSAARGHLPLGQPVTIGEVYRAPLEFLRDLTDERWDEGDA